MGPPSLRRDLGRDRSKSQKTPSPYKVLPRMSRMESIESPIAGPTEKVIQTILLKDEKRRRIPPPPLLLEIPLEIPFDPVRRIMDHATNGDIRISKTATNLIRYFAEEYILEVSKTAAILAQSEGRYTIMDRHIEAAVRLNTMNRGQ